MAVTAENKKSAYIFIVCLGFVSLFADMTYEGAYSNIGSFLGILGAGALTVTLVSGFGEMIAASLRYFSGKLADRTHAYWTITMLGYGMMLLAVPALAFAGSWQAAALLFVAERTGKALRGPARDVLLSEATETVGHGWGFGLHSAMDQTGAVAGPLVVAAVIGRTHNIGAPFLWLGIPAVGTIVALIVARSVRASQPPPPKSPTPQPLPQVFWLYVVAAGVLAMGFIDFPLLAFHFQKTQLFDSAMIPLLYSLAMGVNGLAALIFGKLFDRHGILILAFGIAVSVFSLPLGFLFGATGAVISVICWAIGLGVQDASLRSGIAQVVSMNKRGSAFGAFNGVYGIMWLAGSVVMGLLYTRSLVALVAFGMIAQISAAILFLRARAPLAAARLK